MTRRSLARLARMDAKEIAWRGTTTVRALLDRARTRVAPLQWSRTDLLARLAPLGDLAGVRVALKARRWAEAQAQLAKHFARAPQRFPVGAQSKRALSDRIRREFPDAATQAAARAERILAGRYDLLGYRGLRFEDPGAAPSALPQWHFDPVHARTVPRTFWSTVPFLDPAYGDHKIIWELNRHQHWLELGRAFWLTGDRRYRQRCLSELASWLEANPPYLGVNWASMLELAFRSLSWVWALNLFVEPDGEDTFPWIVDLLVGIDRQLAHVEHNLSLYFSPNTHLTGEALALYVSGRVLPELAASSRRSATGRRILLQEIDRQIAADGGHCERSTHYHRYTLDFYSLALIVARNTGDEVAPQFAEAVARLAGAARLLADDNGRVPHIGDDDGGALMPMMGGDRDDLRDSLAVAAALLGRPDLNIDGRCEETLWLLGSAAAMASPVPDVHPPSGALPDTGYYVSRSAMADHLVIDGGAHGYGNGGHAHADALSLTLTVRGVPLLIDPGTACYTTDAVLRDRMRSTEMHNTLTLDERSQSVPSGAFKWSHVANGLVHRWQTSEQFDYFDGAHDGYRPMVHRRRVLAMHGDLVVVADLINGSGAHAATVHWHLDPRWTVETRARGAVFTRDGDARTRVGLSVPQGVVEGFSGDEATGLGWYSPAYGRVDRTTAVRIAHDARAPMWMMSVFDLDPENPVAGVDWVPVWAEAGRLAHAAAIRITRAASVDHVLFAEEDTTNTRAGATGAAGVAEPAIGRLWRAADVETNARMLFYRSTLDHPFTRVAFVDGSVARAAGHRGFDVRLPGAVPVFFSDGTSTQRPTSKDQLPCAALPVS